MKTAPLLLVSLALTASAHAGEPLAAVYVTDSSNDNVWRLQDFNFDGDYNEPGELVEFYSDVLGPFSLSNNNSIELAPDGTLYLADTSNDFILGMRDIDLDGECNDIGETWVFFDLTNAEGIDATSVADLVFGPDGRLWAANANNGGGGFDGVFWMQDLNGDGDANDMDEAGVYYDNVMPSVGDTIPTGLEFGPDGEIYYVDIGATGVMAKGVYRLEDTDLSGMIDQPGEAAAFFIPTTQANNPFFWDLELGADGAFYMADSGNELIWRFADTNANDVIDNGAEDVLWWQTTDSLIWQLRVGRDGSIFAAESQAPDRVLRFSDDDASGTIDQPGEAVEVYDDTISLTVIGNPRGMAVDTTGGFGTTFCDASDNGLASCPCGPGAPETGCDSPIPAGQGGGLTGGIRLEIAAQTTNVLNRATVTGSGYPAGSTPTAIVIRDPTIDAGGPFVFGDGLRCVGTVALTRLGATVAAGGTSVHTFGHGAMAGVGTFYYQLWFRSTPASYCDPTAAFNLSNGQTLTW